MHPDEPICPPAEILLRFSHPPQNLIENAKPAIDSLIDAAEVKKGTYPSILCSISPLTDQSVPEKAKGRGGKKEAVKPLSGLDIDALLGQRPRTTISPENAIPEFKQAINTADDDEKVERAVKQMGDITRKLIQDSYAGMQYSRAAENLSVMRQQLVGLEMPGLYNKFLTSLKKSLLSGELNGDRREMWYGHVVSGHLGLITKGESEASEVTEEEANSVSHAALAFRCITLLTIFGSSFWGDEDLTCICREVYDGTGRG